MKPIQKYRHLRLVTASLETLSEGPITRLDLWYRYQPVNYKKMISTFCTKIVLLRALIYLGFQWK